MDAAAPSTTENRSQPMCRRCGKPATFAIGGDLTCDPCRRLQPSWIGAIRCASAVLALLLVGCQEPWPGPAPDPVDPVQPIELTGEMQGYYRSRMLLEAEALEGAAAKLTKETTESEYRKDVGARLKAATETASDILGEADATRLGPSYEPDVEKQVLLRRAAEARAAAERLAPQ